MMNFNQFGAYVWWASGINTWGAIFELFGGTWKELGMSFLDRVIWFFYRINPQSPANVSFGVYQRNAAFLQTVDFAQAMAAIWFRTFFLWNLFIRITADGMYDADWEDLDARGLDYSITQATSYHYWEGKE